MIQAKILGGVRPFRDRGGILMLRRPIWFLCFFIAPLSAVAQDVSAFRSSEHSVSEVATHSSCQILALGETPQTSSQLGTLSAPSDTSTPTGGSGGDLLPIPWGNETPIEALQLRELIHGVWTISYPSCGTHLRISISVNAHGRLAIGLEEFSTETGQVISYGYGWIRGDRIVFWVFSESLRTVIEVEIAIFKKQQFPRTHWDREYFWCDKSDHVFILRILGRGNAGIFVLKRPSH